MMSKSPLPEEYRELVNGCRVGGYEITGVPVSLERPPYFRYRDEAEAWLEDNLPRVVAAGVKLRRCLCCQKQFMSLGAGNRMCQPCRRLPDSDGMPASFSFRRRSAAHV